MNVYDAIMNRRTIRKFEQKAVKREDLTKLVDCARVAAYGANVQPLKFAFIDNKETLSNIYPFTKWAGALTDGAPKENERPAAYIAVLGDKNIKKNGGFEVEAGAAVTTMMLEAVEMGLATCWLGAIMRDEIKRTLSLDETLDVVYLLAVGYPMQKSRMVDMKNGEVKYFESEDGTINVPKRPLDEVLIEIK
ncbi:MAG: nitroreductase family protein [Oscillospiraceae bacterium]|nr:nitroreductase family protein [Oscillospiraceae bacterium]